MKSLTKKNIPFLILLFLLLIGWVEEAMIVESYFSKYLHFSEHRNLRFLFRGIYSLIIFVAGYYGLSKLSSKWVKILWLYWYGFAFLVGIIRIYLEDNLSHYFSNNLWNLLSVIYFISMTVFPYFFLYIINFLFTKKSIRN